MTDYRALAEELAGALKKSIRIIANESYHDGNGRMIHGPCEVCVQVKKLRSVLARYRRATEETK